MQLQKKFRDLESMLLHDRDHLALHSGVPFVLLVYPPEQERLCRDLQAELMEKLRARDIPVIEHRVNTFIFDYYKQRLARRGGLETLFALERDDPDALRRMIRTVYEEELVSRILSTTDRAAPDGLIFLTGVGTIYPFGRVSNLLAHLENKVQVPLVVFYPGSEINGQLSFLNLEPNTGYRARVI